MLRIVQISIVGFALLVGVSGKACHIQLLAEAKASKQEDFFREAFSAQFKEWVRGYAPKTKRDLEKTGISRSALAGWTKGSKPVSTKLVREYGPAIANELGVSVVDFFRAAGISMERYSHDWFLRVIKGTGADEVSYDKLSAETGIDRAAFNRWGAGLSWPARRHAIAMLMWKAQRLGMQGASAESFIDEGCVKLGFLVPPSSGVEAPPESASTRPLETWSLPVSPPAPRTPAVNLPTRPPRTTHPLSGFRHRFAAPSDYYDPRVLLAWRNQLPNGTWDTDFHRRFLRQNGIYRPDQIPHSFQGVRAFAVDRGIDWRQTAVAFGLVPDAADFGNWLSYAMKGYSIPEVASAANIDEVSLRKEIFGDEKGQFTREEVMRIAVAIGLPAAEGLIAGGFYPTVDECFDSGMVSF